MILMTTRSLKTMQSVALLHPKNMLKLHHHRRLWRHQKWGPLMHPKQERIGYTMVHLMESILVKASYANLGILARVAI